MMRRVRILLPAALMAVVLLTLSSCVHEWPEINNGVKVRLKVHHELPWSEYEYTLGTRGDSWEARYIINAYRKGDLSKPVYQYSFTRDDLSLDDFETELTLPEGEWEIYAWQDLESPSGRSYYTTDNFYSITYTLPYTGDTDKRDAFEGRVAVNVPATIDENPVVTAEISLERPFAKYVFIATDFRKFYNESVRSHMPASESESSWSQLGSEQKGEALKKFSVAVRYPLYMPAVYNLFTQKITNSWTGIGFGAEIRPLSDDEAVIATDYVMMNHHNSGAQVQLSLKSPGGTVSALTSTVTVPLKRGQITYIRGEFLTASVGDGLNVDFEFSGDFNIKI